VGQYNTSRSAAVVLGVRYNNKGEIRGRRALVRYADDLVVFCETKEDAQTACQNLREWLALRGLRLSEAKTRIVHLSEGFDFLGFNVRHYRAPKTSRSGWKLLIKPSKASVQKLRDRLKQEWRALTGHSITAVLKRLNPILRGWANYFRIGVSKETFGSLDYWMFKRCVRYVKHTHRNKGWRWCQYKYWGVLNPNRKDRWVFGNKSSGSYLLKLCWTPIVRHVLVKGTASPDDPALRGYWIRRQWHKIQNLPPRLISLAHTQRGRCAYCQASLFNGEALHQHHLQPKGEGGKDERSNLQLVHLYCHQQIHSQGRKTTDAKRLA
jgi:RNA-directed DNA polymerase